MTDAPVSSSDSGAKHPRVTLLGESLPYADGAEAALLQMMTDAADTSAGSDELADLIVDWPTQYHLSPARANLLLPLQLGPGMKVLDVGCGTGALLRSIAESGADAVGLEGSYDRCLVAAERLRDLPNAQVMCGSLDDYVAAMPGAGPAQFDVIVVCGVLEYTGSASGGEGGPLHFLRQVQRLLAPGGVVALAIENQWGLKYLLGYPEDHFDRPWVGVEGYWRTDSGVRTWSREGLTSLFSRAGLRPATWYASMPDYKLPTVLIREDLLKDDNGRALAKQFVRSPLTRPGPAVADADPVLSYHAAVDGGLGLETANSFLVMLQHEAALPGPPDHVRDGMLWLSTSERRRRWRSVRRLLRGDAAGWQLELVSGATLADPPLRCQRQPVEPVHVGDNAEDLMRREYLRAGTTSEPLRDLLARWSVEARSHLQERDGAAVNFDVMPNNFIVGPSGDWVMVDTEFSWQQSTATDVFLFRSLWYTADRLAAAGRVAGLDGSETLLDLVTALADLGGIRFAADIFEQWVAFEQSLMASMYGWDEQRCSAFVGHAEGLRSTPIAASQPARYNPAMAAEHELLARVHAVLDETRDQWLVTQRELDRQRLLLEQAHDQVHQMRARLKAMEASTSWRVTAPLRRVRAGGAQ